MDDVQQHCPYPPAVTNVKAHLHLVDLSDLLHLPYMPHRVLFRLPAQQLVQYLHDKHPDRQP